MTNDASPRGKNDETDVEATPPPLIVKIQEKKEPEPVIFEDYNLDITQDEIEEFENDKS